VTARRVAPAKRLRGEIAVPGDKSISHRAAIFNAVAEGEAIVHNFLSADDCLSTLRVLRALGVACHVEEAGAAPALRVAGAGLHGLHEAADVLECGNSGTTMRLMAGLLAAQPFLSVLTGDASLRTRPMARVIDPLREMGARIDARDSGRLAPIAIRGGGLRGIRYRTPVASAQVKSALLLAGLYASGETIVEEPEPSRDHTERMLEAMGARIRREGHAISIQPAGALQPASIRVPNDISAAAFWMVAAAAHPDAELRLPGIGINPTRSGIIDILRAMGADISAEEERIAGGEPVADIVVRSSRLHGIVVEGDIVPRAIDELPAVAVAAACADGRTEISGAAELRAKESDRIAAMVQGLSAVGVKVEERADGMIIEGGGIPGGGASAHGDHRIAMAFAIAGLLSRDGVAIDGAETVAISYPAFWQHLGQVAG
jgi:3-phosphoshikimate 1-carboxyvinyltransferase